MNKFLNYPYSPHRVSQPFGVSLACINPDTRRVSSKLNGVCLLPDSVDLYNYFGMKSHNGIDIPHPENIRMYSPVKGTVVEIQTEASRGLGIGIITDEEYEIEDLPGVKTRLKVRLWHLNGIGVQMFQKVNVGDYIGLTGNTGYSSGPHTHFEMKPVTILDQNIWSYINTLQSNGWYGAVDPEPYWTGEYAQKRILTRSLEFGQTDDQVNLLQETLKSLGYFPHNINTTYYYGIITATAVYNFQRDYKLLNAWETLWLKGNRSRVGPKTIGAINKLINK